MTIQSFAPSRQSVQIDSTEAFKPLANRVFVTDMDSGEKITKGGLIVMDDNGKERGIRPRWGKVWKVGEGVSEFKPGDWILIEHGRWSFKMQFEFKDTGEEVTAWQVDYLGDCVIGVSETNPLED